MAADQAELLGIANPEVAVSTGLKCVPDPSSETCYRCHISGRTLGMTLQRANSGVVPLRLDGGNMAIGLLAFKVACARGDGLMSKFIRVCAAAAMVVAFSGVAVAQDPGAQPAAPQGPAVSSPPAGVPYLGPGTYSSYGNQTYGPSGTQYNLGNGNTLLEHPNGSTTTYSTYGHQTYGSDGSLTYSNQNRTYQNNGTISDTHGNQTYIYKPGGGTVVCSTYGSQQICR